MHVVFFRILKLFFITGFLLQYVGNWYRTSGPLVNFTIFNTSNKNKAGDINSPWNLLVSTVSSLSFQFLFLPCPSFSSLLLSLLSLFTLSLGDITKWPTRVDLSLYPNTNDSGCWYKFICLMTNSADPDQLASLKANLSGSTLFAKTGYIQVQQDKLMPRTSFGP